MKGVLFSLKANCGRRPGSRPTCRARWLRCRISGPGGPEKRTRQPRHQHNRHCHDHHDRPPHKRLLR